LFTVAIFGSFPASFLDHFQVFGRRMIRMDRKMKQKMATVNALKRKHLENEVHHQNMYLVIHSWHVFSPFQLIEANIREKFIFSLKLIILDINYKRQK
jgi:hypothetical protein